LIDDVIDLVRTTIEGQSALEGNPIRIRSSVPKDLPKVTGAGSELRQVFINLLLNAYEAIHQQGEIEIDSAIRGDRVIVTVSDNGPGIAPNQLDRIFDPFFTTKKPAGTGLGLSIAKNIIEESGGRITASNRSEGGAVFTLEFPVAEQSVERKEDAAAPQHSGCRFLLVDDDVRNLEALKDVLRLRGHYADTAESGREALEKLRSSAVYDIVLCDLAMPEINGWEVARVASEIRSNLNFYIVTGWGEQVHSEIPLNLPVRGVLSKPIDLLKLDRIVATLREQTMMPAWTMRAV
jgi:CheY-like chemotaxis protein